MNWSNSADDNQKHIVETLRAYGARVWFIGRPVDLLVVYRRRLFALEVKNPKGRNRTQPSQEEFLTATVDCDPAASGIVRSAAEALELIGAVTPIEVSDVDR